MADSTAFAYIICIFGGTRMNLTVNTSHPRAIKARYRKLFISTTVRKALALVSFISALFGVIILVLGNSLGWLILIVPTILLMLHEWFRHDLRDVPIGKTDALEDLLSADVLAVLPRSIETNEQLQTALKKTSDYWFLTNRLLLFPDAIATAAIADSWLEATKDMYRHYPTDSGITAAHLLAAIVLSSPDKAKLLSLSQNTEQDIHSGLQWYMYVQNLMSSIKKRSSQGGIARDWAAGYAPLLDNFAINLSRSIQYGGIAHRDVIGHANVVEQMQNVFSSNGRANIALVGDVGVGKSTCIQAFAEALLFSTKRGHIAYNQIYQIDIASVLTRVAPEQLEYTIQRLCSEAYHAKNIVLYFDNAGAFFGANDSPTDATNIILPIIEGGRVRMIFSFTKQDWQYMQKAKSQVAALLNYQVVNQTDKSDTLKVLENQALFTESQYNCTFTYGALKEVYALAERYGPDIGMPGRAISVLEDAARSNQGSLIQNIDVQKTVEQTTGIKVATASLSEKSTLLALEDKLKQRVVGQDTAVKEIVAALKRSRTGIANPNKPIGTFLFLGPTGVGKTETSKALADEYFGGNSGFVRVDMNEYITQDSIHALLAGSSAYGSSFLETIRRQPFSVVLLDEIEKAHPDIINTFLQMLDEGQIHDSDNRAVSFKDAIIIATSNAGAEEIRSHLKANKPIAQLEATLTDILIEKRAFAPEFINRFDSIVIFSPLKQEHLEKIVQIQLQVINTTLTTQGITVALAPDAVEWLITQGYDERLGARPLRRMMQKTVETAVSNVLLAQQVPHGSTITLRSQDLQVT